MVAINFALYLCFIWIEYIFHTYESNDTLGLKTVSTQQKIMESHDFGPNPERPLKAIDLLRQAVVKVKALVVLSKAAKESIKKTYQTNPVYFQYFYLIVVFLYTHFLVFFWIAAHQNPFYSSETGIDKFICTSDEMSVVLKSKIKTCQSYLENRYTQVFYALNLSYFILSMSKIRGGKGIKPSEIIDFTSMYNQVKFYTYVGLPLIREAASTFQFCVKRTCLAFEDFMLVVDLKEFLYKAKIKFLDDREYKTGHQISRCLRMTIMFSIVNLLIISIIFPLFLFSSPTVESSFPLTSGKIQIDLIDQNRQKIGELFYTDKFRENRPFNVRDAKDLEVLDKLWTRYPQLNKFSDFRFHRVSFSKFSDDYLKFTPKIMEELGTYLAAGAKTSIKMNITMTVRTLG